MDNRLLVAELKAASPGAVEAIHDSYADGLFQYCWFVLRNSDAAAVALRDSLIVAAAHIARLDDPDLLKPWLYALARVECLRRRPSPASDPDILLARSERNGGDPALLAWRAVMDVGPLEREVLELSTRQRLDLRGVALVLGIGTREAELLLIRARESLAQAVAGEILGREGQGDCPDRAAMLTDYDGTLTAPLRERLVSHARRCTACGRHLPRNASATKVYGLLTRPEPPEEMRMRTLACLGDPDLAGYRAFVAGRAGTFDMTGFPLAPATAAAAAAAAARRQPSSAHLWVGLAAALVATALGVGFAQSRPGGFETVIGSILPGPARSLGHGTIATPALSIRAARRRARWRHRLRPGLALPLGGLQAASPAGYLQLPSRRLDLGAASSGSLVITASEGPVAWSASTSSPDLVLSSRRGWLAKGGKVTLILSRARDSSRSSQAQVTIGPGNLSVLVTWISPSASSPPSPSPGPSARPSHASSPRPSRTRSSEPSPGPSAVRVEASVAGSPVSAPESGPLRRRGEARQQAQPRPKQQDRPEPKQQDRPEPKQQDRPEPKQQDRPEPKQQDRPEPKQQDRPEPKQRDQWRPWRQDRPEPWQQDRWRPWRQDEPGPWQQDRPEPWQQDRWRPWRQTSRDPGGRTSRDPGGRTSRDPGSKTSGNSYAKVRNAGRSRGAGHKLGQ